MVLTDHKSRHYVNSFIKVESAIFQVIFSFSITTVSLDMTDIQNILASGITSSVQDELKVKTTSAQW